MSARDPRSGARDAGARDKGARDEGVRGVITRDEGAKVSAPLCAECLI